MVLWKMPQDQVLDLYDSQIRPSSESDIEKEMQERSVSRTYFFLASFLKPPEQNRPIVELPLS
jgi:hypothetical protein